MMHVGRSQEISKIVCAAQVNVHAPHAYLYFCKTDASLQQEESKMIRTYVIKYIARWVKNTFSVSCLTTQSISRV